MARKRMYDKQITDSDAFTEMSSAAQALYFHLNQGADDDGFNNQIQMAMFKAHASNDDLKILMAKNFIIRFDNGVIVIKHWRMHNVLRKDRYTPTSFQEELAQLGIKENGAYTLWLPDGCQTVAKRLPQVSKGKVSKGKLSVVEVSSEEDNGGTDSEEGTFEFFGGTLGKNVVLLTPAQQDSLLEKLGLDAFNFYMDKLSTFIIEKDAKVGNHYKTILKWAKEDARI